MTTALLLIALGFGYKIYTDACDQKAKPVRRLGKTVAIIMMIFSLLAAICTTTSRGYWGGKGYCPSCAKGKSGWQCPFAAKKGLPYSDLKSADFQK